MENFFQAYNIKEFKQILVENSVYSAGTNVFCKHWIAGETVWFVISSEGMGMNMFALRENQEYHKTNGQIYFRSQISLKKGFIREFFPYALFGSPSLFVTYDLNEIYKKLHKSFQDGNIEESFFREAKKQINAERLLALF